VTGSTTQGSSSDITTPEPCTAESDCFKSQVCRDTSKKRVLASTESCPRDSRCVCMEGREGDSSGGAGDGDGYRTTTATPTDESEASGKRELDFNPSDLHWDFAVFPQSRTCGTLPASKGFYLAAGAEADMCGCRPAMSADGLVLYVRICTISKSKLKITTWADDQCSTNRKAVWNIEATEDLIARGGCATASDAWTKFPVMLEGLASGAGFCDCFDREPCAVGGGCADDKVCMVSTTRRMLELGVDCPKDSECFCTDKSQGGGSAGDDWLSDGSGVILDSTYCKENAGLPEGFGTSCSKGEIKAPGDECIVICPAGSRGYDQVWKCGSDGVFKGRAPQCQPINCLRPQEVLGINASGCRELRPGNSCNVTCQLGFDGGWETLKCDDGGMVTPPKLQCEPKFCEVPETFTKKRLQHDCHRKAHGSSCWVRCGEGFEMEGRPTKLVCQDGRFRPTSGGELTLPRFRSGGRHECQRHVPG